jgi:putative spermidine/putrescine transport system permease protein
MTVGRPHRRTDPAGRLGLALFLGVAVLPIAFALAYAAAYSVGAVGLLREGVSLDAWRRLLGGGEAAASFALSLAVASATVALAVGGGLALALALRRRLGRGPLGLLLYAPLTIPATVAAFLVYKLLAPAGLLPRWLDAAGLVAMEAFPRLVNDRYALGIVIAHVGLALPYLTLLFAEIARSERLDDLVRMARTLGASRRAARWRVEVPVLLRRAVPHALLLFVAVFGSYEIPLLLGRQAPQMVSVLILRKFERFNLADKPEAFALALLYAAVAGGLIALLFRATRPARTEV